MNKVILVCEGLHNRAGIERMTVELANLLSEEFEVIIVVIDPFSYETCPFMINSGIKVVSLNTSFMKSLKNFNIPIIKSLRKIFKTERPKAVITVATPLVRLTAPACLGLKIRNIAWEHFNIYAGSRKGAAFKAIAPWFVKNTVVLTEEDEKDYRVNYAPRVVTIPNFTTIGNNEPSACSTKVLLAVGRHANQKGFDLLIQAWAKTDAPGWVLRIVGSGDDKQKNEQLAKDLGVWDRIEFIEAHPDIAKEFQNSSCFVLSSRYEGLVLVLIEAKMMGLPCISFDCPNSPREVIRNGLDGWLVPKEDIDALAKELSLRLSDPEALKKAGKAGREDAIKRYSPEAIKNQWLKIIDK
ncbi:MAG: glycosyltransferase family 4 protein [Muribaculaceae bacterium]|nr:glycosyltransferase family 4 protein [Muribaculaceae bacterium]MDE6753219.1 glycosyltransferase family 4 protein [Muribaculaceae bacterium]